MGYNEKTGHWPLMKGGVKATDDKISDSSSEEELEVFSTVKDTGLSGVSTRVRSVEPISPA